MLFYSLVSLRCHLAPFCPLLAPYLSYPHLNTYFSVSFHSAPIFSCLKSLSAHHTVCSFSNIVIHLLLFTCSLFICSSKVRSLLPTSSLLSWESTRGALMLLSSSSFSFVFGLSLLEVQPVSSSGILSVLSLSSVTRENI